MALETTSMPLGIRPISRPQTPGGTEGIARREDGSSGFSPRTDLAIKTAIDDMAGILSKISAEQTDTMQKMPEDLQRVVQNIMKNAFAMDETLLKGFGSSLESQRFSLEQLQIFARMLTQMGALSDKGFSVNFSESMQTFLTNLKNYLSAETDAVIEPVLLNKVAFELLDTKSVADLPPVLKNLLTGLPVPIENADAETSLMLLKQLVRAFMPRPAIGGGNTPGGMAGQGGFNQANAAYLANNSGMSAQGGNLGLSGAPASNLTAGTGMPGQANIPGQVNVPGQANPVPGGEFFGNSPGADNGGVPLGQTSSNGNFPPSGANQNGFGATPGQTAQSGQGTGANPVGTPNFAGNASMTDNAAVPQNEFVGQAVRSGQLNSGENPAPGVYGSSDNAGQTARSSSAAPNGLGQTTADALESGNNSQPNSAENLNLRDLQNWLTRRNFRRTEQPAPEENLSPLQQAKNQILRQPLQNVPSTMDTMKSLASLLLKDAQLTVQDAEILQNFVNGNETVMSERDARQLQTLLRLCQQNIPASVQQAAIQQNMPDLPRLWAFMQLCDMSLTKNMSGGQLKKAGKDVGEFSASVKKSTGGSNSVVQGKRSLNFMLPLFFGDDNTSYPSYVHVYDEDAMDQVTGEWKKETWLRLCLLTDNIGAVDMVCRIFDGEQLDVRLFFSDRNAANEFREYLPELRQNMRGDKLGGKLRLNEIKVGAAGERRFL